MRATTLSASKYENKCRVGVGAKITSAKSSNPKVISVKVEKEPGSKCATQLVMTYKKIGKATIKYTLKGKAYRTTIHVVKSLNPFSMFKIGSESFAKEFSYTDWAGTPTPMKGVLRIKPAAGWKIVRIDDRSNGGSKAYHPRNGAKLKPRVTVLIVTMKNTRLNIKKQFRVDYWEWEL